VTVTVGIRDGAVYLPAALAETHFKGIDAVIILIRDGAVNVLPVHRMAAGGCLLKVRNAAGDRVAVAPDVFRANGLDGWQADAVEARWSDDHGALVFEVPSPKLHT
jgi:hypothetical protein